MATQPTLREHIVVANPSSQLQLPRNLALTREINGMIERTHYVQQASNALQHFPACALLGPRQCGKTTLALELKKYFEQVHHFDLEDPLDFAQFDAPKILRPQNTARKTQRTRYHR